MGRIHILVTVPLQQADIDTIAAVDPTVEITYAMEEVRAELGIPRNRMPPLENSVQQAELSAPEGSKVLDRLLTHTEIIFGWRLPREMLSRAPRLQWIQASGAGLDILNDTPSLRESGIFITNARGRFRAIPVAEFTLSQMLMLAKGAVRLLTNQMERRWDSFTKMQMQGKTVGIVGLGTIGREIAGLASAFNMRVLATKRSVQIKRENVDGVDVLFPPQGLLEMISQCDFVILSVPLTVETRGLISEAELKAMKPTAFIINVARGPVIKQDILLRALKEKWIAGAALDVFETEPLPADSEFWGLENVIVTPHTAGLSEGHSAKLTELFCENLRRFLKGSEMVNLIDGTKEY